MDTIYLTTIILTTTGFSILLYKYIVSKQRLQYDSKINGELIIFGFIYNLLLTIAYLLLETLGLQDDVFMQPHSKQLLADALYSVVFFGGIYFIMNQKVIKPLHYINKYDIVIYSLCLGIGIGISNILFVALLQTGFNSALLGLSAILVPISYMMILGFFLIKFIEGNKKALILAFLLPVFVSFIDNFLYRNDSWIGIMGHIAYYFLLYGIFITLFFRTIRKNVQFDGIDPEEQMEHFENNDTFREKVSYWFDSFMSHGKIALGGLLLAIGLIVVLIVTFIILTETPEVTNGEIGKTLWLSFMRVLDPGNVATDPEFNNPKFVLITTVATFIGLALVATYIGMVSGDFGARIERLREGNSKILERGHILLIGFSEDTLSLIDNLIKFHRGKKRLNIVIASSLSRKEMEDQVDEYGLPGSSHRIICRSGDLESRTTLMDMGITNATHVVILGDKKSEILRISMMVNDILKPERFNEIDVLMQLNSSEDLLVARNAFGSRMKIFSGQERDLDPVIRACVLKEYLRLYGSLIGVDGDLVVSLESENKCVGKKFGEIINSFVYSDVIGLIENYHIILNPDKNTIITKEHQLILLTSSESEPDYIGYDRKFSVDAVKKDVPVKFISESVKSVLLIGDQSQKELSEAIRKDFPEVKKHIVNITTMAETLKEIDMIMFDSSPDIVVLLGSKHLSQEESDDICMKLAACMDLRYNRKQNNYVTAAMIYSSQDTKFAYELDYVDMVIDNDSSRRIALEILDDSNMIIQVEEKLLEAGDRIGAVLAAEVTGMDEKQLSAVYRDCIEHDLILVGYIVREGGFLNVVLNPNKNGRICFDDDDLLLVLK